MSAERILTVSQLNEYVKMLFDSDMLLRRISVKGEISNFTNHRSGHWYFSLKDNESVISAVMFRSYAEKVKFNVESGMNVIVTGRVSSFVRDGKYQLYVEQMEPDGIGSLYLAFEQLKEKLGKEGLFDQSRKPPIPKIPYTIGVITSPTGAALRDIINITGRRFPFAKILIYPALVQGESAEASLIGGIKCFNEEVRTDVIIIGRGGGSIEDLWPFNGEGLARAIAASSVPVISAVGHETDFTICDFVSSLRAPTPSGAAELAVPRTDVLINQFNNVSDRMYRILSDRISTLKNRVKVLGESRVIKNPTGACDEKRMILLSLESSLLANYKQAISQKKIDYRSVVAKLDALNPLAVINRGYGVARKEDGGIIKSVKDLSEGEKFTLKVSDGEIMAKTEKTIYGE